LYDYLFGLLIESYGPIGLLTVYIWYQQRQQRRAILRMARANQQVEEETIYKTLRRGPMKND
jgi:hypothetical protein